MSNTVAEGASTVGGSLFEDRQGYYRHAMVARGTAISSPTGLSGLASPRPTALAAQFRPI